MAFSANPINQIIDGNYMGYSYGLATTDAHIANAPVITPINGKTVILFLGASTPKAVCSRFQNVLDTQKGVTVRDEIFVVNGCVPSTGINRWKTSTDSVWTTDVPNALSAAGLTFNDVSVVVTSQDDLDNNDNTFPSMPKQLKNKYKSFLSVCLSKMPNLKQVHLLSRQYTGWTSDLTHAEPCSYNNGWTCKWLVEDFISGTYTGVYITDGCYPWTDGETIREDGFQILMSDYDKGTSTDYIHMNSTGNSKVANLVHSFLLKFPFYAI
jgi:hypothetical protein